MTHTYLHCKTYPFCILGYISIKTAEWNKLQKKSYIQRIQVKEKQKKEKRLCSAAVMKEIEWWKKTDTDGKVKACTR